MFYEFYKLPEEKVDEIWEKGLLIVDTNVLLDLYRLSKGSRKDLMKSIEFFGERIWSPYQATLEFLRNREAVIKGLGSSKFEEFIKVLNDKAVPELKEAFKNFQRHPCIDFTYIEKRIESFRMELEKKVEGWKNEYPFDADNDDVLKWVTKKYDGKVGEDYDAKLLLDIYSEGAIRYKAQVPPGYKDANNKDKKEAGERYVYGDLIIWKSVVEKAKKDKLDIIFLTNDTKEDWYEKHNGQAKAPRFELLREFHKETAQDIIIMSEAAFLNEMKERKSVKVKDSSIEDAERAIKPESPINWKDIIAGWSFGRTLDSSALSAISPNTIFNVPVAGSLDSFKPVVFPKVSRLEDYHSIIGYPKEGFVDTGYLESMTSNPFLSIGGGKDEYKEDKDNEAKK